MKKIIPTINFLLIFFIVLNHSGLSQSLFNPDTVKAQQYDMGKMWTFENPPLKYFADEYKFNPSPEWLEKVRKSALKLSSGCSASFVSEDGLIMTNHHCVRGLLSNLADEEKDENFLRDGFYAEELSIERSIPNLYVEQLIVAEDVTDEVLSAMNESSDDNERITFRDEAIKNIIKRFRDRNEEGLGYTVTSLYNGGRYSLYGYKKYDDLRLVFVPDLRSAKMGGDYDNFTYPRHGLDFAFLRAYENGVPVKSEFYFPWSDSGAVVDEPIFVIGNPGTTERIKTIVELEYDRDVLYPPLIKLRQELYDIQFEEVLNTNAEDFDLIAGLYSIGNALKVYRGILDGLRDPVLMARKNDFEKQFKEKINQDPELDKKYGYLWDSISVTRKEMAEYYPEIAAYSLSPSLTSKYYQSARDLVRLANELSLPEEKRHLAYTGEQLEEIKSKISSINIDKELETKRLGVQIDYYIDRLGRDHDLIVELTKGLQGREAAEHIINNSVMGSPGGIEKLAYSSPDEILDSDDPLIRYIVKSQERLIDLRRKSAAITAREKLFKQLLGEALYEVYGETIPPDATFTLRIADGVISSYPYNGTIAPPFTTFYGVLDKYYSFNKKFPFNLNPIWENLPDEFDLSAPLNFISTNDIIGGNSGSAVINRDGKIVGLAFDGNYESLPNRYIYTTEANRTISVHSVGMIESIRDLYQAKKLSDELLKGKLP